MANSQNAYFCPCFRQHMTKVKYQFNTKSLSYERVKPNRKDQFFRFLSFAATGLVFAVIGVVIAYNTFDSPREKQLEREIERMKLDYDLVNQRIQQMSLVLNDLQDRDDNIYRVVFEADPIPEEVRKAGFGGVNRYSRYKDFENGELLSETMRKTDILSKQLAIQSKSYDELLGMIKNKAAMLACIPAIQPVSNKDLKRMSSGFGYRTDPIYKTSKFHAGMDFAAAIGTEIYATGDGVVERADSDASGYGNHVRINHGYGYLTLYGHMSKLNVRPGQKIKRGEVIGYVGNTGKSSGPHLHYEVHKDGERIDPVNFFYNDLNPEDYARMLEMSGTENQSFD
jgi:murein DD-endopeptidase MepM/ murein hydrolase activator NlpD